MAKQKKQRSETSSARLTKVRQTAAKQAIEKRSKGRSRISKDQVADVTAQINDEFAQVQTLYAQSKQTENAGGAVAATVSVQDLADVMKGL